MSSIQRHVRQWRWRRGTGKAIHIKEVAQRLRAQEAAERGAAVVAVHEPPLEVEREMEGGSSEGGSHGGGQGGVRTPTSVAYSSPLSEVSSKHRTSLPRSNLPRYDSEVSINQATLEQTAASLKRRKRPLSGGRRDSAVENMSRVAIRRHKHNFLMWAATDLDKLCAYLLFPVFFGLSFLSFVLIGDTCMT